MGSPFDFKLSDLYTSDKSIVIDKYMEVNKKTKEKSYDILPFKGLDFDVFELVRNFSIDDIMSLKLDIEISVG